MGNVANFARTPCPFIALVFLYQHNKVECFHLPYISDNAKTDNLTFWAQVMSELLTLCFYDSAPDYSKYILA